MNGTKTKARLRGRAARSGRSFDAFRLRTADAACRIAPPLRSAKGAAAANDMIAKDVLDACAAAGVAVPGRVLVLGVDDEEFVCR